MQHLLKVAALAGAVCVLSAPTLAAEASFELAPFTAIDISSGIDAAVTVGGPQKVTAESPHQGELDELIVEMRNDTLVARTDWNLLDLFIFGDRQIKLHITVPSLDRAEASSGADIEVTGLEGDRLTLRASSGADIVATGTAGGQFDIEASSGSDITIDGTCDEARIGASSGATIRAGQLTCARMDAETSSGADAEVFASAAVTAEASSGGDITVLGEPASVEQEASSGGDISFRD